MTLARLTRHNSSVYESGTPPLFGDTGDTGGIGTSTFEVQQHRAQDPSADPTGWEDKESIQEAGDLKFTPGELALTPGDTVYAPVALRTTADSLGGTVTLQAAVDADGQPLDTPLANALQYRVGGTDSWSACGADTFASNFNPVFIEPVPLFAPVSLSADIQATSQALEPKSGNVQYYCFEVALPQTAADQDELQGEMVSPHWEFLAESASAYQG